MIPNILLHSKSKNLNTAKKTNSQQAFVLFDKDSDRGRGKIIPLFSASFFSTIPPPQHSHFSRSLSPLSDNVVCRQLATNSRAILVRSRLCRQNETPTRKNMNTSTRMLCSLSEAKKKKTSARWHMSKLMSYLDGNLMQKFSTPDSFCCCWCWCWCW